MVASQVLVVLGEELRVLESDNRTVERLNGGGGIGDGFHRSLCSLDGYVVAHLDAASHERYAVVEVLQDVFHGETDTR